MLTEEKHPRSVMDAREARVVLKEVFVSYALPYGPCTDDDVKTSNKTESL